MAKHGSEYERVPRDLYPTPRWVTAALLEHVDVSGKRVWEPAAGSGQMVEALKAAGARVYATDINADGYPLDQQLDFVSKIGPEHPGSFDAIITNPPYGDRGALIDRFIEAGLQRLAPRGLLALLLPTDCDSAKRRAQYFRDCAEFGAKIVLTRRIVWFESSDGKREAPKENHAWYVWRRARSPSAPSILYAPASNETAPVPAGNVFVRFTEVQCRILSARSGRITPAASRKL